MGGGACGQWRKGAWPEEQGGGALWRALPGGGATHLLSPPPGLHVSGRGLTGAGPEVGGASSTGSGAGCKGAGLNMEINGSGMGMWGL